MTETYSLQQTSQRCGKQRAPDAKQLTPGHQSDQRRRRMDTYRLSHHTRANDVAFNDMHDGKVGEDDE